MLYTPKYCNECGSEIKRDEWKLWTSRRFCENCEDDFKGQKFLPAIWIFLGLIGIVYGFGSYLKSPQTPLKLATTSIAGSPSNKTRNLPNQAYLQNSVNSNVQTPLQKASNENVERTNFQTSAANSEGKQTTGKSSTIEKSRIPVTEAIYICGAQTKKGTACQRRVRGGGRCWQHKGQPSILPPEKLLVSR